MINFYRLLILLFVCLFNTSSYADDEGPEIKSATVDGSSSTSITSGATIEAEVILKKAKEWQTTKWIIKDSGGSTVSSQCHTNSKQKSEKTSFSITGPSSDGTYSISFIAYKDDKCHEKKSNTYTLSDAIVVGESSPTLQILLHMDESNWDGTSNEVVDSSGNNYSGSSVNGANTSTTDPAIAGNPGSCSFGSFDGVNDYINIDNLSDKLSGTASLSFWIRTTQTGNNTAWQAPGVTGIEQNGGTDDIFWGWLDASGHIGISIANDNSSKSTIAINDGSFHHIVLSRNASNGNYKIYIDGELNKSGSIATGIIGNEFSSIGRIEDTGNSPEYFSGDLDEIQIFDSELSLSQVQSLMDETHACSQSETPNPQTGSCGLLSSNQALYSTSSISLSKSIKVNDQSVHSGNYSPKASVDRAGTITTDSDLNLPALDPASFPANSVETDLTGSSSLTINETSDVYYRTVKITDKGTITFTGGGPFHINELKTEKEKSTINFAAGTYYINKMSLKKEKTTIKVTSGPVYLHIGSEFKIDEEKANINESGNVDDLVVFLHSDAKFEAKKESLNFTGIIYGPDSGKVSFKKEKVSFHGLIVVGGAITISKEKFSLIYTETDKAAIDALNINGGNNCSTASEFNCVSTGRDPMTGTLLTKISDQAFTVDVIALENSNTIATTFAGNVTLELVDASTGSCETHPALNPEMSQSISFDSGTGIATSNTLSSSKAYKNLKCRITDSVNSIVACSADGFSIRPERFSVSSPVNNSGHSGSPTAKAGAKFTITAETNVVNYDGTPVIDASQITAHTGANQVGVLAGSFTAADPATGKSKGSNFTYSEVGTIILNEAAVIDSNFVGIDKNKGDCTLDASNTVDADGKVGCYIANTPATTLGRFIPDHFKLSIVEQGSFGGSAYACTGFNYFGQAFSYDQSPEIKVTAYNGLSPAAVTQNYSGNYAKLTISDFDFATPTTDANQLGADNTNKVNINWQADAANFTDNHNGSLSLRFGDDSFTYLQQTNSLVAPFTNAVEFKFTKITDSDGVITSNLPLSVTPSGALMRFGRLNIASSHGSELAPLIVSMSAEYFNGTNWTLNSLDNCSSLDLVSNILLSNPATGNNLTGNTSMKIELGSSSASLVNSPFSSGQGNLNFSAPGEDNQGYIDIKGSLAGLEWLQFDWNSDGDFTDSPSGRASFGLYSGSDKLIFRREMY
jgi:hypothetical protein